MLEGSGPATPILELQTGNIIAITQRYFRSASDTLWSGTDGFVVLSQGNGLAWIGLNGDVKPQTGLGRVEHSEDGSSNDSNRAWLSHVVGLGISDDRLSMGFVANSLGRRCTKVALINTRLEVLDTQTLSCGELGVLPFPYPRNTFLRTPAQYALPYATGDRLYVAYNQASYLKSSTRRLSARRIMPNPHNVKLEAVAETMTQRSFFEYSVNISVEGDQSYRIKLHTFSPDFNTVVSCLPISAGQCGATSAESIAINAGQSLTVRLRHPNQFTTIFLEVEEGPEERSLFDNQISVSNQAPMLSSGFED